MKNYLVITGASKGIGEKTADYFIQQGWEVVNISRSPCRIAKVKNMAVDLSSLTDIAKQETNLRAMLKDAQAICLVHNAGYYESDSMNAPSVDILEKTLAVNVIAPVALNKIMVPLMPKNSCIVYIGSTLSEQGAANSMSYITSKHAVIGLMRASAQDLATKTIRSVCVCPGFVETEMLKANTDLIERKVLAKRLINPEEIASVIHFAAISPVLNNTVIHANLGQVED